MSEEKEMKMEFNILSNRFVALYKRFVGVVQTIQLFNSQKYRFSVDNLLELHKQLSEEER